LSITPRPRSVRLQSRRLMRLCPTSIRSWLAPSPARMRRLTSCARASVLFLASSKTLSTGLILWSGLPPIHPLTPWLVTNYSQSFCCQSGPGTLLGQRCGGAA
jgi:hypothetical protein